MIESGRQMTPRVVGKRVLPHKRTQVLCTIAFPEESY
jgi:hypothetical protein